MGAHQGYTALEKYDFKHGADFLVEYVSAQIIERRDKNKILINTFRVSGAGYVVKFGMMRLLPTYDWQERNPRKWGFGDIFEARSDQRVWNFNEFTKSPEAKLLGVYGFKGDMTTVCGEDNRTYVECRDRDGVLKHRFLLAKLLSQWKAVEHVAVPPLPTAVPVTRELPPPPPVIFVDVPAPEVVPAKVVTPVLVPQTRAPEENPRAAIAADVTKVVHRSSEMLYFVREVLSRMPRAPEYLRHF